MMSQDQMGMYLILNKRIYSFTQTLVVFKNVRACIKPLTIHGKLYLEKKQKSSYSLLENTTFGLNQLMMNKGKRLAVTYLSK